ncbi:hypothetical protein FRC04_010489 [Tulasnella sp. 424]|nr:hypothetical protein FRC04_010489 [Tulasnella sp. 424]
MPSLSPDPSYETNRLLRLLVLRVDNHTLTPADLSPPFSPASTSVIANCFLLSSLCFSLLAAVGAMLGKEWLQNYDHTGQSGPLEAQGRFRQQKYTAAQQWHLEEIVQLLPNVLLLSVLLFFVGLIQLLIPMIMAVAGLVIALAGLGTLLALATIIIGAVSSHCPYQSATSRGLRWVGKEVSLKHKESIRMVGQVWSVLASTVEHLFGLPLRRLKETLRSLLASGRAEDIGGGPSNSLVADKDQIDLPFPSKASSDDILNAQAASWLLDVTSNIEDQLAVAQNICNLLVKACEILVQDTDVWRRLLLLIKDALQQWQSQPSDVSLRNIAEQFGVALYHLLAGYPRCSDQWEETCRTLPSDLFDSRRGPLEVLKLTFMPIEAGVGLFDRLYSLSFTDHNVRLKKAFLHRVLLSTREDIIWHITSRLTGNRYDDGILCMLALWVLQQFNDWRGDGSAQEVVWGHQNGPHWSTVLLGAYEGWFSSGRAKTYLIFLRKFQDPVNSNETTAKRLVESLGKMIMGVEWTHTDDGSIEDPSRLLIEII